MIVVNGLFSAGKKRLLKELEILKDEGASMGITACPSKNEKGEEILDIWDIYIKGPPETFYENHVLHAKMHFPSQYPFHPPTFTFVDPMFHPNIYTDGKVCISILHSDGDDPTDLDSANCSWTPGQNIRTVCLSIISLLNSPNIFSPANVDASKMYRDNKALYAKTVKELLKKGDELKKASK